VACKPAVVSRTGFRYCQKDNSSFTSAATGVAQYPRYGYLMLQGLRKGEGLVVNRKHTYRLYTEEALQVYT